MISARGNPLMDVVVRPESRTVAWDAIAAGLLVDSSRREAISRAVEAAGRCPRMVGAMTSGGGSDGV